MRQSKGTNLSLQTQKLMSSASNSFRNNKTLWLAGMLTFFIPSVAAGAWYAGTNIPLTQDTSVSADVSSAAASTPETSATAGPDGASATAGTSTSSAGNDGTSASTPNVQTEVTINGKPVEVPSSGNLNQTTVNNDGSTSSVNISVNSSGNANGFSSSSTHMHSNSSSFSNNNGTNTNVTNITNVP